MIVRTCAQCKDCRVGLGRSQNVDHRPPKPQDSPIVHRTHDNMSYRAFNRVGTLSVCRIRLEISTKNPFVTSQSSLAIGATPYNDFEMKVGRFDSILSGNSLVAQMTTFI